MKRRSLQFSIQALRYVVGYWRKSSRIRGIAVLALLSCLSFAEFTGKPAFGQRAEQRPKSFPLLDFSQGDNCQTKGRLQDQGMCQAKVIDQIITQGKEAVPILISQITDTRALKQPAFLWNQMTVGDLANAILEDLFTDSDWETFNLPGLESIRPTCRDSAENCWHMAVKKYGRKFIQSQWLATWNKNKDHMSWDTEARCFRLQNSRKNKNTATN